MEPKQNNQGVSIQLLQVKVLTLKDELKELKDNEIQRILHVLEKNDLRHIELEQRLDSLEKEQPMNKLIQKWVIGAVWTAASAVVFIAAKFMGIM